MHAMPIDRRASQRRVPRLGLDQDLQTRTQFHTGSHRRRGDSAADRGRRWNQPSELTDRDDRRASRLDGNGHGPDVTARSAHQFLRGWLDTLDRIIQEWLNTSVLREARERAVDGPRGSVVAEAIEVMLEACADAHGLSRAELRHLIPGIDVACADYVVERIDLRGQRRSGERERLRDE
jgi:hypothetical protein